MHGRQVNITDGRYVYMRAANADNQPLFEYTLMPTHTHSFFTVNELSGLELAEPFSFTQGLRTLKVPIKQVTNMNGAISEETYRSFLYDLETDPSQDHPMMDSQLEAQMATAMKQLMRASDAPEEQFVRMQLQDLLVNP